MGKNVEIKNRMNKVIRILKENNKINTNRELIDSISKYLDTEKFELESYYKKLENILYGLLKKVPKDISWGMLNKYGINPDYLNGKDDIMIYGISQKVKAFKKLCKDYKIAISPYKFTYNNGTLKIDSEFEKYKFICIKVDSNLIKYLIEINALFNDKRIKDKNKQMLKLYKKYNKEKIEEYVLIKTRFLTDVIGNTKTQIEYLKNIVNVNFLNDINSKEPISKLKRNEYKIDKKEEIKLLEWQIKKRTRNLNALKNKLKKLKNKSN